MNEQQKLIVSGDGYKIDLYFSYHTPVSLSGYQVMEEMGVRPGTLCVMKLDGKKISSGFAKLSPKDIGRQSIKKGRSVSFLKCMNTIGLDMELMAEVSEQFFKSQ